MTMKDFLNTDWNKINAMSHNELKSYVAFGAMQANRFLSSARKGGYTSPGLSSGFAREARMGRKFQAKNLNTNQLRRELKDLLLFLDNKTLTRKAANKFYSDTLKRVSSKLTNEEKKSLTKMNLSNFWDIYSRFTKETDRGRFTFGALKSETLQQEVFKVAFENNFDVEESVSKLDSEEYDWLDIGKSESPF